MHSTEATAQWNFKGLKIQEYVQDPVYKNDYTVFHRA